MKLTNTQAQILAKATARQDRLIAPPAIPPGPRGAIEAKLRTAGLIEQARLDVNEHPAMAWRQAHGQAVGYRITEAGLTALGTPDADMPCSAPTLPTEAGEAAAGTLVAAEPENAPAAPSESATGLSRVALRDAAHAVLAAWDGDRHDLHNAIAALRSALAGKAPRVARDPTTPRKPREGTKQQQVLTLLRRPEGATVAHIAGATGWQHHTVRGFFAGLEKRQGIAVAVQERVRQVGPGKDGAKGSFSVYRIADAG